MVLCSWRLLHGEVRPRDLHTHTAAPVSHSHSHIDKGTSPCSDSPAAWCLVGWLVHLPGPHRCPGGMPPGPPMLPWPAPPPCLPSPLFLHGDDWPWFGLTLGFIIIICGSSRRTGSETRHTTHSTCICRRPAHLCSAHAHGWHAEPHGRRSALARLLLLW